MPVREMANPIPVLTGSEYRDRKTMKKHVMQNTTGKNSGTCGQINSEIIYCTHKDGEKSGFCRTD